MNSNVSVWYENKKHIDEMKCWEKGKLKIWEQQVTVKIPIGAKILDIGSGLGREAFALNKLGFEVVGLDISNYAVEKANEKALMSDSTVEFYHYDGEHIPFIDEMFDIVIIWSQTFGLLYGDSYKENCLREYRRVLKPGGLLSYSGHSLQYIRKNHNNCLEGNKFYPYIEHSIYWETFSLDELENYAKRAGFTITMSGEGEIYVPEDGIVLYCLCKAEGNVG